ncbi:hypothetical protein K438DRAFT_1983130 [Mycena galopus ATCC 62051]|nr:hypothetical protein K438DRAFT_1983130 [Mycena galopus ATCC 62051]
MVARRSVYLCLCVYGAIGLSVYGGLPQKWHVYRYHYRPGSFSRCQAALNLTIRALMGLTKSTDVPKNPTDQMLDDFDNRFGPDTFATVKAAQTGDHLSYRNSDNQKSPHVMLAIFTIIVNLASLTSVYKGL